MSQAEPGFAVITAEGKILVRTTSPTPVAAMVNAIITETAIMITRDWSDERITNAFTTVLGSIGFRCVPVAITRVEQ